MSCAQTIEEIKGHRQEEILAMLPYLDGMYVCILMCKYIEVCVCVCVCVLCVCVCLRE